MSGFDRIRTATSIEVALIAATMATLPLFEAPKNIFSLLFLLVWIVLGVNKKNFGSKSVTNIPIFGLAAILWVAPFFSDYGDSITALNSAPRWTMLALFAMFSVRLNYSSKQLMVIWVSLMLGGAAAVAESLVVWSFNGKDFPEFRSVGHVNHSSMYSLVTLAAGIGAIFVPNIYLRLSGVLAILSTFLFLGPSSSTLGFLVSTLLVTVSIAIIFYRKWSVLGVVIAAVLGVAFASAALISPFGSSLGSEIAIKIADNELLSSRDKILNSALAVWENHPILGTGWFSFGVATSQVAVTAALEAQGLIYDPERFMHFPHGHNLWTTLLIERGITGIILIFWLLYLYIKAFLLPIFRLDKMADLNFGSVVSGLLIILGFILAGLGNTTMMNEHGHAGMVFAAVIIGHQRHCGSSKSTIPSQRV